MALANKRTSSQEPNISMTKQAFHSSYGKDPLISSSIQLVLDEGESSQQKLPSSSNSKCNNFVFESTKNPILEEEAQSILSFNNGADNWLQSYNGNAVLEDDGFATWDGVIDHEGFTIHLLQEANNFETLKNNIKCQFDDPGAEVELFLPKNPILIDSVKEEILSQMIRNEHKNDGIKTQFFSVSRQKENEKKRQTESKAKQCNPSNSNHAKCLYLEEDLQASKRPCLGTSGQMKVRKQMQTKDPQIVAAKKRRERISERLKALQELIPNGSKVDLVTMLGNAISYVKFLQLQVKVLAMDEFWPVQGGKAPEVTQVKEAIDAILSSH